MSSPHCVRALSFPLFSSVVLDPHPSELRQSQAQHARHPADKSSDHSRAQTAWRELQRDEVRSVRSGLWHSLAVIEESFQILLNCQGWKHDSVKQGLSLRGSCSCVFCLLRSSSSQADWIWPDASNRIPSALLASHLMSENSVQRARTLKTRAPKKHIRSTQQESSRPAGGALTGSSVHIWYQHLSWTIRVPRVDTCAVSPNVKADSSRCSFFSLFLEDAPLRSLVSSHIQTFSAHPKKKKVRDREKVPTSRGVDRHFRWPGRQKWWRKGKTSSDTTRKCSKG